MKIAIFFIQILLIFVRSGPVYNNQALVNIMACDRIGITLVIHGLRY